MEEKELPDVREVILLMDKVKGLEVLTKRQQETIRTLTFNVSGVGGEIESSPKTHGKEVKDPVTLKPKLERHRSIVDDVQQEVDAELLELERVKKERKERETEVRF